MFPFAFVIVLAKLHAPEPAPAPAPSDPPVDAPPVDSEPIADPTAPPSEDPNAPPIEASDPQPEPEPEPESTPPPKPIDTSVPTLPPKKPASASEGEPPPRPKRWPDPLRKGGTILASAGVAGCSRAHACDGIKVAGWFSISGGYRFGRFAPIAMVAGGGAPSKFARTIIDESGEAVAVDAGRASLGFLYVGAGTLLHLLQETNFDPWFGMTLGYFQNRERSVLRYVPSNGGAAITSDDLLVTHRGAIGLQLGIGFRILKRFTIGPRFDFFLPFAGKACGHHDDAKTGCIKLSDDEKLGFDATEYFPRPWSVGLQVGFVL